MAAGRTTFRVEMKVRDYECDMQGIVNNAVYQNYLEYARHEYLESRGLSFAGLTAGGIIIVMVRAELDYRQPLRAGEAFYVTVHASQLTRLKIQFKQEIYRVADAALMLEARITTAALKDGKRPYFPEELRKLLN